MTEAIRQRPVLTAALLQTLQGSPRGLTIHEAYDAIDEAFEFPEKWYRHIPRGGAYDELKDLGYKDWRGIPQERLVELVSTEPQWQNEMRWARNDLRKLGLLDTTAPRGVWRLTKKGLREKADVGDLSVVEREIATPRKRPAHRKAAKGKTPAHGHAPTRENLLKQLQMLAQGMPLGDLALLLDVARSIRKRSLVEDDETK